MARIQGDVDRFQAFGRAKADSTIVLNPIVAIYSKETNRMRVRSRHYAVKGVLIGVLLTWLIDIPGLDSGAGQHLQKGVLAT